MQKIVINITIDYPHMKIQYIKFQILLSRVILGPMMYISWNVARLVRVSDFRFYSMLKFYLQRSLWSLQVQNDFIKDRKIDMVQKKDSKIFYCHLCRRELFLYIWVRRKEDNNGQKRRSHCQVRDFLICVLKSNGFFIFMH